MLRLLGADETKDIDLGGGTKFRVRKLPHGESVELTRRNTKRGRLDEGDFERDLWERVLVGWEGLLARDGKPVEFHQDLVWQVSRALPHEVAELILATARSLEVAVHGALGNSEASSPSGGERAEIPSTASASD